MDICDFIHIIRFLSRSRLPARWSQEGPWEGVTGVAIGIPKFFFAVYFYCCVLLFDVYMTGIGFVDRLADMEFTLFNQLSTHSGDASNEPSPRYSSIPLTA